MVIHLKSLHFKIEIGQLLRQMSHCLSGQKNWKYQRYSGIQIDYVSSIIPTLIRRKIPSSKRWGQQTTKEMISLGILHQHSQNLHHNKEKNNQLARITHALPPHHDIPTWSWGARKSMASCMKLIKRVPWALRMVEITERPSVQSNSMEMMRSQKLKLYLFNVVNRSGTWILR